MAKRTKSDDSEYQAEAEQAVKETANIKYFAYSGDLPLGKTWAFVAGKSRDSDLLEESNYESFKKTLEKEFPEDVEAVHSSHWAVGWVDELAVRMLDDKGKVTEAGKKALELKDALSDYPVLDDSDYSERQTEATIQNIMSEGRIDEEKAGEVYGWLWDNNERALQDLDDQGGYPSREQIEEALEGLGYIKDEETEEWRDPDKPYEDPSQLKLFGSGRRVIRPVATPNLSREEIRKRFPKLSSHLDRRTIKIKDREYVGIDRDGVEVSVGTIGYETAAEDYLEHHPTPDTW